MMYRMGRALTRCTAATTASAARSLPLSTITAPSSPTCTPMLPPAPTIMKTFGRTATVSTPPALPGACADQVATEAHTPQPGDGDEACLFPGWHVDYHLGGVPPAAGGGVALTGVLEGAAVITIGSTKLRPHVLALKLLAVFRIHRLCSAHRDVGRNVVQPGHLTEERMLARKVMRHGTLLHVRQLALDDAGRTDGGDIEVRVELERPAEDVRFRQVHRDLRGCRRR